MKIDTKKLKDFLKKIPRILVERFLLTLIFLLILSVIVAFFIFKISTSFKEGTFIRTETFNEKIYRKIIEKYDEEKRKFEEIDQKVYLNPFEEK
jgi:predicted neutral ceramidase superfamily lipid hydrolase